jgi:hypothetical protein
MVMGTAIFVIKSDVFISKQDFKQVFSIVRSLEPSPLVRNVPAQFAFVDNEKVSTAKNLYELMFAWRWYVIEDEHGDVCRLEFLGEKSGDEKMLFQAIAPFVRSGSQIIFATDQGHVLRWYFNDSKVFTHEGRIVFD